VGAKNYSITGPSGWVDGEVYVLMAQDASAAASPIVRMEAILGDFEKRRPR
jgi:hypothetical protein